MARVQLDAASNGSTQSECVLQKHVFWKKKKCKYIMDTFW
jgi:hypothetical protein